MYRFVALSLFVCSSALALAKPHIGGVGGGGILLDPSPGLACAEPPPAPTYVAAGAQGSTSLGFTFSDSGDCETSYLVQHRNVDATGAWVTRATLPAISGTNGSYTDTGLLEDTYYCYRVVARSDYGSRASTSQLCMKTREQPANREALHDVRVRVKVAPFSSAGTDSSVLARLNAKPNTGWYPIRNETWLDYGRNDLQANDNWTFILNATSLPHDATAAPILSDISQIVLDVQGSDTLCISELELLVNGSTAYSAAYGTTATTARCGSQGAPIAVNKAELRSSPQWQSFNNVNAPIDLSEAGVVAGLEAQLGHRMHGTPVYWNDSPAPHAIGAFWLGMQARPETNQGFVMNVPLRASVNNWFDPQVLIQMVMDMESKCVGNRTTVTVSTAHVYADVGFDWWADVVHTLATVGVYFLLEPTIDGYVEGEVEPMELKFAIPIDGCYVATYTQGFGFGIEAP